MPKWVYNPNKLTVRIPTNAAPLVPPRQPGQMGVDNMLVLLAENDVGVKARREEDVFQPAPRSSLEQRAVRLFKDATTPSSYNPDADISSSNLAYQTLSGTGKERVVERMVRQRSESFAHAGVKLHTDKAQDMMVAKNHPPFRTPYLDPEEVSVMNHGLFTDTGHDEKMQAQFAVEPTIERIEIEAYNGEEDPNVMAWKNGQQLSPWSSTMPEFDGVVGFTTLARANTGAWKRPVPLLRTNRVWVWPAYHSGSKKPVREVSSYLVDGFKSQAGWIRYEGGFPSHVRKGSSSGTDIDGASGDLIVAAAGGKVIKAVHTDKGGYGIQIAILHQPVTGNVSGNLVTLYGHFRSLRADLKYGSIVAAGEFLGYMGTTGSSSGPHLHFEIKIVVGEMSNRPLAFINPETEQYVYAGTL